MSLSAGSLIQWNGNYSFQSSASFELPIVMSTSGIIDNVHDGVEEEDDDNNEEHRKLNR
jgi:hypothetical protein